MKIHKKDWPELWDSLPRRPWWKSIHIKSGEYSQFRREADRIYPHLDKREREHIAMHNALTHVGFHKRSTPLPKLDLHTGLQLAMLLLTILLLLIFVFKIHAEPEPTNVVYDQALRGLILRPHILAQTITPPALFKFDASSNLDVNCIAGCSAAASFSDNTTFTAGTTAIGITGGWYSAAPTNCTTGNACAPQLTIDRKLFVQDFQGTSPWVVSGTVSVTNFANPLPVTGTFFQATQPVSCTAANCLFNLAQVGGSAVSLGNTSASSSIPVTDASNTASGTITTTGGSNLAVNFSGMGCVGIVASGVWTGSLSVQQSNDGVLWQPADTLQQLLGKWQESISSNGRYYTGGFAAQQVRLLGPTATGTATISMQTSSQLCNEYTFAIPGTELGIGFPGQPIAATGTQTTTPDGIQGHKEAEIQLLWSGITGSPAGCQLQPQGSSNGVNYTNSGPPLPITPGTNAIITAPGPLGLAAQFVYTCGTYPGAGTLTAGIVYKLGGQTLVGGSVPEVTAAWTSGTAGNTALTQVVGGYGSLNVYLNQGTTITGGAVTFEGSDTSSFTNAYPVSCTIQNTYVAGNTYTLVASSNVSFVCPINNYIAFRVRLSTAISGTATVNVGISASAIPNQPAVAIGNNPSVFLAGTPAFNLTQENGTAITNVPTAIGTLGSGNVISANMDLTSEHGTAVTNVPTAIGTTGAGNVISVNTDITTVRGTATVTAAAGVQKVGIVGNANATVDSTAAAGAAPTNALLTSTVFNTTVPVPTAGQALAQQSDSTGALAVNSELRKASYRASTTIGGVTLAATPTDIVYISGSATKTVRISRIVIGGSATTAGGMQIALVKRSTANSLGTCTSLTAVPMDSGNAAASAIATSCTANPTTGTTVGTVDQHELDFTVLSATAGSTGVEETFTFGPPDSSQELVLRGIAQVLAVNGNAAAGVPTGAKLFATITWTEE